MQYCGGLWTTIDSPQMVVKSMQHGRCSSHFKKLSKTGERLLAPTQRSYGNSKPICIQAGYVSRDEVAIYKSIGTLITVVGWTQIKCNNACLLDGNGFKTSTMRLGADVIVFSRCAGKSGRRRWSPRRLWHQVMILYWMPNLIPNPQSAVKDAPSGDIQDLGTGGESHVMFDAFDEIKHEVGKKIESAKTETQA